MPFVASVVKALAFEVASSAYLLSSFTKSFSSNSLPEFDCCILLESISFYRYVQNVLGLFTFLNSKLTYLYKD